MNYIFFIGTISLIVGLILLIISEYNDESKIGAWSRVLIIVGGIVVFIGRFL